MKLQVQNQSNVNPIMNMPAHIWKEYVAAKASVFDYVESLPQDEKLVLALHYYEGLSFVEIAWLMGMREWDAVVLHMQALTKLQSKSDEQFS